MIQAIANADLPGGERYDRLRIFPDWDSARHWRDDWVKRASELGGYSSVELQDAALMRSVCRGINQWSSGAARREDVPCSAPGESRARDRARALSLPFDAPQVRPAEDAGNTDSPSNPGRSSVEGLR